MVLIFWYGGWLGGGHGFKPHGPPLFDIFYNQTSLNEIFLLTIYKWKFRVMVMIQLLKMLISVEVKGLIPL